ncbi:unnamed protein product (mitochondrion) [Plasmodiophora brassicae]|uniref:Guanylate cyclase domain-containing protein n=1 Tax=Plasmodiophora brassicae TaxID=37360 RepID=A0A3P3Y4X3_PLABS|nr:unnamed protein product [Plasmodiophora brassicae]
MTDDGGGRYRRDDSSRRAPGPVPLSSASLINLCSYIPSVVVQFLAGHCSDPVPLSLPARHRLTTAVLFADISGYTAMCEQLGETHNGIEDLARIVKAYFGILVKVVARHGGDVFKFAGDAVIVVWPDTGDTLGVLARRSCQCALDIQRHLHGLTLQDSGAANLYELSLKIGIGVGDVDIVHVGGVEQRTEYLAIGSPLAQAFTCENVADPGQVVVSLQAAALVEPHFRTGRPRPTTPSGPVVGVELRSCRDPLSKRGIASSMATANELVAGVDSPADLSALLQRYVPLGVLPFVGELEERWASEIRKVTVLFAHTTVDPAVEAHVGTGTGLARLQRVMETVQRAVLDNGGAVNKFLFDDKGLTVLAVFGLLPSAHANDSLRGVVAALCLCGALPAMKADVNCGVTTGYAFCGVTGGNTRREYSVLGDVVNISARLMQYAAAHRLHVVVDNATRYATRLLISFRALDPITVKGKHRQTRLFVPAMFAQGHAWPDRRSPLEHLNLFVSDRDALHCSPGTSSSPAPAPFHLTLPPALGAGAAVAPSPTTMPAQTYPARSAVFGLHVTLDDGDTVYLDCTDVTLVGDAKQKAARLPQVQRQSPGPASLSFLSLRSRIVVDDALRLDVLPIVVHDLDANRTGGILDLALTSSVVAEQDVSRINQGRHRERQRIAHAVHDLLQTGAPQCLVVQGDLGLGKTHLFASTICDAPIMVVCGRALRLPTCDAMFAWRQCLTSLVDLIVRRSSLARYAQDDPDANRRAFLQDIGAHPDLIAFVVDHRPGSDVLVDPIADLVVGVTRCEPLAIVLDSAHLLEDASCRAVLALLDRRPPGLLIALAVRSPTCLAMQAPTCRALDAIVTHAATQTLTLSRLADGVLVDLMCTLLGCTRLPDLLVDAVLERSRGNPMICRELVYSAQRRGDLRLVVAPADATQEAPAVQVVVSDGFRRRPAFPVPFTLQNTLGELVDSLTHCQRMILKVASVFGPTFTYDMIRTGYPIDEHLTQLARQFQGLFTNDILRPRHAPALVAAPARSHRRSLPDLRHDDVTAAVVTFSTVFLMEFVRSRILHRQVKYIATMITRQHLTSHDRVVLFTGPMSMMASSSSSSSSSSSRRTRLLLGSTVQRWKSVWVDVDTMSIEVFHNVVRSDGSWQGLALWIRMPTRDVDVEPVETPTGAGLVSVLRLGTASYYDRDGALHIDPIRLLLATSHRDATRQWMSYVALMNTMKPSSKGINLLPAASPRRSTSPASTTAGPLFAQSMSGSDTSASDTDSNSNASPTVVRRRTAAGGDPGALPRLITRIRGSMATGTHLRDLWNALRPQLTRRRTQ